MYRMERMFSSLDLPVRLLYLLLIPSSQVKSSGTGKSVLLREIIDHLRKSRRKVAITASTGIAAVNIGGSTIHSWAGIGLGDGKPKDYAGKFLGQKKFDNVLDRWRSVDALIIDEG